MTTLSVRTSRSGTTFSPAFVFIVWITHLSERGFRIEFEVNLDSVIASKSMSTLLLRCFRKEHAQSSASLLRYIHDCESSGADDRGISPSAPRNVVIILHDLVCSSFCSAA